jgi:hypothetical protein
MMPGNDEGRPPQGAPAHIEALRPTEPSTGTSISPASGIPLRLPRGPKAHKALAKQLGILNNKAGELIVLDYGNDPFYMGTPGEKRHAEWFAGLLEQYGLQLGRPQPPRPLSASLNAGQYPTRRTAVRKHHDMLAVARRREQSRQNLRPRRPRIHGGSAQQRRHRKRGAMHPTFRARNQTRQRELLPANP